jgi:hypothetical protein
MKYAAAMGSDAMIYILSFTRGSAIQKLMEEGGTLHGYRKSLLSLFQNKESKLKCKPGVSNSRSRPPRSRRLTWYHSI